MQLISGIKRPMVPKEGRLHTFAQYPPKIHEKFRMRTYLETGSLHV